MAELDELLGAASNANRLDRISWRDPIAAHGRLAIPVMRQWLSDGELGAFAVRVLGKIAERPTDRPSAIEALESMDVKTSNPAVASDVRAALAESLRARSHGRDPASPPSPIPRRRTR